MISIDNIWPAFTNFETTCDHPPGAAPKSNKDILFLINLNFLLISINLKADLDLYPCILDSL